MSNRVIIDQTTNTVSTDQCPEIHNSVVVNNDVPSTIEVTENVTNIVTVAVPGPQGPVGPQGPIGLGGDITGSQYYAAIYKSATGLFTGSLYQSESFTSIRNATSPQDPANPDILYVNGEGVDTYNLISAHGNRNGYLQINVKNFNNSNEASSDIVATADNGTESENYIDMGINSSGFTNTGNVGGQNDAYLYSTGNDLYIGNASPGKQIIIFNGGLDAANQAKVWIHDQGTVGINTDTYNTSNPPSLQVNAPNDATYNIAQFFGNTDNYAQVGIANANGGTTASADLVLYNNIDYENQLAGFVDLGINSTNYVYNGVYPGSAGDAYLFTDSEHLVIGSVSGSGAAKITLFAGGISESDNAKLVLYGNNKHEMTGSLSATEGFSGSLFGTASWALNSITASFVRNAISSSYPIAVTGSTLYSTGTEAGFPIITRASEGVVGRIVQNAIYLGYKAGADSNAVSSVFLGKESGYSSSRVPQSVFIGELAGSEANLTPQSVFLGMQSGYGAGNSSYSNFIGYSAGRAAYTASYSNFFGYEAGINSSNSEYSNFIGYGAGYQARFANISNFIGEYAGASSISSSYSNFIGDYAGASSISSSYSNFIGFSAGEYAESASYSTIIGYQTGYKSSGNRLGRNNIIIGTNVTLPDGRQDSINIGGIIFGTGSYFNSTIFQNAFSGSVNGRIGINQPNPVFSLDVSGSGRYTNGLTVSSSLIAPSITGSLQGTASWAINALTASFGGNFTASNALITNTLTAQTLVVQTITSSTDFVTGSTRFGSLLTNTHQFTGSVTITGSLNVNNSPVILTSQTGSMSVASASLATTASYVPASAVVGLNLSQISSGSVSASVNTDISASFRITSASNTLLNVTKDGQVWVGNGSFVNQGYQLDVQGSLFAKSFAGTTIDSLSTNFAFNIINPGGSILFKVRNDGKQANLLQGAAEFGFTTINSTQYYYLGYAGNISWGITAGNSVYIQAQKSNSVTVPVISFNGDYGAKLQLNNNGVYANSAIFEIDSTTKGFLIPRMNAAQRIAISAPAQGLQVYDTGSSTEGIWYYSSGSIKSWTRLLNDTGSQSISGSLTVTQGFTGSLFGTSSWAQNAVTASYVLGSVNAFPFTGSAQITGSLGITGSLNVGSTNIEYQENTNVTTGTWRVVSSEPTASYRAAFFDYVMFSGSVARAGTVYSVWSASYAEFYENYTGDVGGSTSGVTLQAAISGSNIQLQATSSNNSWTIRSLVRML